MAWAIENYCCTSVDDCKSSVQLIVDLDFLGRLLAECERREHKSRAQVVRRRIRQVEREREREQEPRRWALIVDGRELHVFTATPPGWVQQLTALKGIRLERKEKLP